MKLTPLQATLTAGDPRLTTPNVQERNLALTTETIKTQIQSLAPEDFNSLLSWIIGTERQRREASPAVEAAQAGVVRDLREQGVVEAPAVPADPADPGTYPAWVNPGVNHAKMYLFGDRVSHEGRVWESAHQGLNHWEPNSTGVDYRIWRDITDEVSAQGTGSGDPDLDGDGQPSVAPFKTGEVVKPGDLREYNGAVYRVVQGHTTASHWAPDVAHSLWAAGE